jgi:hypothetical protein
MRSADEVPTLPVKLFNLLDVRHKNEVTTSDLQACLHKLSSNIDQHKQRVIRLEEDNARLSRGSDVELAIRERNEMEIDQIKPVIAEYQHALRYRKHAHTRDARAAGEEKEGALIDLSCMPASLCC